MEHVWNHGGVQGGFIRQQLYNLLRKEKGVYFKQGNTTSGAIHSATRSMRNSKFCLNLAGDTPSSNRLFDSIASHCVPVVISDEIELPFEDDLDYSSFCIFIKTRDAVRSGFVIDLLRNVSADHWTRMWTRLQEVDRHFRYQHPTQPEDAVHMTWRAIRRKVPKLKLYLNRKRRYQFASPFSKPKRSIIPKFLLHW